MTDQTRLYEELAWIWAITSPPEDYEEEAELFATHIHMHFRGKFRTGPLRLLNLGCGSGNLDFWLKHSFSIVGVDLSETMLAHARDAHPEADYRQGDMRTLHLAQQFDAVIIADAIDYMLTEDDLAAAFQTAFEHLRPGGVFLTYADETTERFRQNHTNAISHQRGDVEITAIENFYDPNSGDSTYEATFVYLIREHGKLRTITDQHLCGIFPLSTWKALLESTGFGVHLVTFPDAGPLFVCHKPAHA